MDSIETHTVTCTLRFHADDYGTETAWLNVNGRTTVVGAYPAMSAGEPWIAHRTQDNSVALAGLDVEAWRNVVRLVHLYP